MPYLSGRRKKSSESWTFFAYVRKIKIVGIGRLVPMDCLLQNLGTAADFSRLYEI